MNIIRRTNEVLIQTPADVPFAYLDELIGYLKVRFILAKSQATDEDIEALSEEIKDKWWQKNKERYLRGRSH